MSSSSALRAVARLSQRLIDRRRRPRLPSSGSADSRPLQADWSIGDGLSSNNVQQRRRRADGWPGGRSGEQSWRTGAGRTAGGKSNFADVDGRPAIGKLVNQWRPSARRSSTNLIFNVTEFKVVAGLLIPPPPPPQLKHEADARESMIIRAPSSWTSQK